MTEREAVEQFVEELDELVEKYDPLPFYALIGVLSAKAATLSVEMRETQEEDDDEDDFFGGEYPA